MRVQCSITQKEHLCPPPPYDNWLLSDAFRFGFSLYFLQSDPSGRTTIQRNLIGNGWYKIDLFRDAFFNGWDAARMQDTNGPN